DMRAHGPDLLMIAGDLFDSNGATPTTIEWAMEMLSRQPFPIVMIPGNHDCMAEDAIYRRYDFNRIANVDLLAEEAGGAVRLSSLDAVVWGKGMADHSPDFSPLGDCPARPAGCRWYLGLGHGIFVPHGEETGRSSPIHMQQIEDSPCDYLALGHHHAAMRLVTDRAAAAYSGSPTDTIGRGATYVIVDLLGDGVPTVEIHAIDGEC
ncbi:MAG: metallophosphoesterase, partial [Alphaproteobacteria bacterium]|nr:metallophosphoesterase [Alphaproteobacteria bacterium]